MNRLALLSSLALVLAAACDGPPKPDPTGDSARAVPGKTGDPRSEPVRVLDPTPSADSAPAAEPEDADPGDPADLADPGPAGPSDDPAATPQSRKDAALTLLGGGPAVTALPVVDADPDSTLDPNLATRLQPRADQLPGL